MRFPEAAGNVVENALKGLLQHAHTVAPVVAACAASPPWCRRGSRPSRPRAGSSPVPSGKNDIFCANASKYIRKMASVRTLCQPRRLNRAVENGLVLVRNRPDPASAMSWKPRPVQLGQAPAGVVEGEHSRRPVPSMADAAVLAGVVLGKAAALLLGRRQLDDHKAAGEAGTPSQWSPSGGGCRPSFSTSRSTTSSMVCFLFFSQRDLLGQDHRDCRPPAPGRSRTSGRPRTPSCARLFSPG